MPQQQERERFLPAVIPAPPRRKPHWQSRRHLAVGIVLLVCGSLLLIATLFVAAEVLPRSHPLPTPGPRKFSPPASRKPAKMFPTPTLAASTPTPVPQNALIAADVDDYVTAQVAKQQFSGSVLIAHNGYILLNKGYSMADWDTHTPNTPQTVFYLGSTTKQFTAMAILLLQEQGKLRVEDHLCAHISPCPPTWQQITIHEMLTHTSGIPQLDDADLSDASPQAWIASYNTVPTAFTPGSQFDYCSVCYQILGYVVEQVSGEPYSAFLQKSIFGPLHMTHTGFDSAAYYASAKHSQGYADWQDPAANLGWEVGPQWSFLFGSGLLYSTTGDLFLWDQALYNHTLISQHTLDEAFHPYETSQYAGSDYGYGWFIAKSPVPGHHLIWHDGRIDGFRTYIGRYIDDQVTIIFLSNLATLDDLALAQALQRIVFAHLSN